MTQLRQLTTLQWSALIFVRKTDLRCAGALGAYELRHGRSFLMADLHDVAAFLVTAISAAPMQDLRT
ncbi:hypothetical protein SADO_16678 [Salinisphaera dokdonensis CL-ES53]|uniref:Uncharacterized protein n=1 Tax=Salinisphaera dokdonensis CL-ES53 TaxID=1304272 RepID=A0ABV2B5M8_9GAMM